MALRPAAALTTLCLIGGCAGNGPAAFDAGPGTLLSGYDWQTPESRCRLPPALDEVSGLVDDGRGGLLAHHDNGSELFRVSCTATVSAVPGVAPRSGDFEGVARSGATLYLLTSPGFVYTTRLRQDGRALAGPPTELTRAAAGRCGFEGIAAVTDSWLVLACKYPRDPLPGSIRLYDVPLSDAEAPRPREVGVQPLLDALGLSRLRPSGLAWLPDPGRLLVLAGKERVLFELSADGTLLAWRRLSRRLHRQAEGLAVLPDGRLAIADEADGRRATLTIYGRRAPG